MRAREPPVNPLVGGGESVLGEFPGRILEKADTFLVNLKAHSNEEQRAKCVERRLSGNYCRFNVFGCVTCLDHFRG